VKIILGGHLGAYLPGDTIAADDKCGQALIDAGCALSAPDTAAVQEAHPKAPTLDYLRAYAADHGCSLTDAAAAIAAAR
jgi:hypothetical protein